MQCDEHVMYFFNRKWFVILFNLKNPCDSDIMVKHYCRNILKERNILYAATQNFLHIDLIAWDFFVNGRCEKEIWKHQYINPNSIEGGGEEER